MSRLLALLALPALLGACATTDAVGCGPRAIALGPGGRAEALAVIDADTPTTVHLTNEGPGRVDALIRVAGGATLHDGPLTDAEVKFTPSKRMKLVIVLEAGANEGVSVGSFLEAGKATIEWDLSRAGGARR